MDYTIYLVLGLLILIITFTLLGTLVWDKRNIKKRWIAVGNGNVSVATSVDGYTWEPVEDVFGLRTVGTGTAVSRAKGIWVVAGQDGDEEGDNIWWSNDGEIWNSADSTEKDIGIFGNADNSIANDVKFSDGLWVAVGLDGTDYTRCIWWSVNGKEWTPGTGSNFGSDFGSYANVVRYENGMWIVGGTRGDDSGSPILYSEDGLEWKTSIFPENNNHITINDIYFGDGTWVATGKYIDDGKIWYSDNNGKNWYDSSDEIFFENDVGNSVIYFLGKWIVVGGSDNFSKMIYHSDNGREWKVADYPVPESGINIFHKVKYLSENFYVFGSKSGDKYILKSSNGEKWTETNISNGDTDKFVDGEYGDGTYVAVGDGNDSIYYSTDGDKWNTVKNRPFGNDATLYEIYYG